MSPKKNIFAILLLSVLITGCTLSDLPLVGRFFDKGDTNGTDVPIVSDSGELDITERVNLEYWGMFEPVQVMEPLINEYMQKYPNVVINYTQRDYENDLARYKRSLLTRLKEGSGPSIFRVHSTWVPEYYSEISQNNSYTDLNEFDRRFYPVAKDQCVDVNGKVLCIPLMYDGLALFYNVDMFNAEGLTEPRSWDEVREAAIKLTKKNGAVITRGGAALGTAGNVSNASDILGLMFAQSNVTIPDSFDTEAAASALTFYVNFSTVHKVWDDSMPDSIVAFSTQKVAMIFARSWQVHDIFNLNPTLKFAVAPLPQLPNLEGSMTNDTWASFWVETVSSDLTDAQQKAAWHFLDWLSQPKQQLALYSEASKYRRFGEIYSDVSLQNNLVSSLFVGPIIKDASFSTTSIITEDSGNDEYVVVMHEAINAVMKGQDPLTVLKTAKLNFQTLQNRGR